MRQAGGRLLFPNLPGVVGEDHFSDCSDYRYALRKKWGDGPTLVAILLNPSTANADADDPTVRRVLLRAMDMGYGALVVCNAYAYRATNPRKLREIGDPVGPDNDKHIQEIVEDAAAVLVAWGNRGAPRAPEILAILAQTDVPVYRLGDPTGTGSPRHPLYLRKDTALQPVDLTR